MSYIADPEKVAKFIKELEDSLGFAHGMEVVIDRHPFKIYFSLRENGSDIGHFTLVQQINCCGLLVSTGTWVEEFHRGQGIAHEFMNLKVAIAKEFGFSAIMATVDIGNSPAEVKILEKFGWVNTHTFINSRTKHTLGIFVKDIK